MVSCKNCGKQANGRLVNKTDPESQIAFCSICERRGHYNSGVYRYVEGFEPLPPEPDANTYVVRTGEWPDDDISYAGHDVAQATSTAQAAGSPATMQVWNQGNKIITLVWNGEKWGNPDAAASASRDAG